MLLLLLKEQDYIGNLFEIEQQGDNSIGLYFDVFVGNRDTVFNYSTENIMQYETGFFRMNLTFEQFADFFSVSERRAETLIDTWFLLKGNITKGDNSVEATFYSFDFEIDSGVQNTFFNKGDITALGKRKKDDKEFLAKLNSLVDLKHPYYNKSKTEGVIAEFSAKTKSIRDISEINVVSFNVGQGNATGIFDKDLNPIFYYDLGGGAYWNKHTYRTIKDFPVTDNPFIILSHWDFDHYESIKAKVARYAGCKIIAPLQKTTPSIRKFAAMISENLFLIDNELGRVKTFSFLKLFKCSGKTRNDSGLGMILDLKKDENISEILLPGDSQYFYIKPRKEVDAICVSHHGGKIYNKRGFPAAKEKGNGYCVYSYGADNIYKHPFLETIQEHINRGWGCDRFMKKYSLSTTIYNVIYNCDINISALYNSSSLNSLGSYNSFHGIEYNREEKIRTVLSTANND